MSQYNIEGVNYKGKAEIETYEKLSHQVVQLCEKEGYTQVSTPNFENYELYRGNTKIDRDKMVKTIDNNGRILVLRPDATIPITKMAANRETDPKKILKYCYATTIFREYRSRNEKGRDFLQTGVEYFGDPSAKCDAEIIGLAISVVKELGFKTIQVDIGNVNYLEGLFDALDLKSEIKQRIRCLIETRNLGDLESYLEEIEVREDYKKILLAFPNLFGSYDRCMKEAQEYVLNDKMREALDRIQEIYNYLVDRDFQAYIKVDLAFTSNLNYYSAMVFNLYAGSAHTSVLSGGRYDNLSEQFGIDRPACGFGMNLNLVIDYIKEDQEDSIVHIALAKGRVAKETMKCFSACGIEFPEYSKESRKLLFLDKTGKIEVIFVKSPDVPVYVQSGAADLGVVGKDVLNESDYEAYELMNLNIGKCMMATAKIKDDLIDYDRKIIVGTKYPKTAKKYFDDLGVSTEIIKLNGSVELGPIVGLSDIIVDIVETGSTLRENGLEVDKKIMDIGSRLICNKVALKTKRDEIEDIVQLLEELRD
ncbi:MAG: ATP phosphoribosyltransferase [Gallicola sp.]|nr:ATP phosphoribosyltransferase [Gallicola sp.]